MELARRVINCARMTVEKWKEAVEKRIAEEPFTIVEARHSKDDDPQILICSVDLLNHLMERSDRLTKLMEGGEYEALRNENGRLRATMDEVLQRLQLRGELKIDNATWKLVRSSIFDNLDQGERLWTEMDVST